MSSPLFRVDPRDDVAVALRDLEAGEEAGVTLAEAVPRGHKVALRAIGAGEIVRKFGFPVGIALCDIAAGAHVHSHNLATALATRGDYAWRPAAAPARQGREAAGFLGYRRADGRVGTRNEIWVIPTVGCVARTAQKIAERAARRHEGRVDGIHAFAHPFGCSQLGDDLDGTRSLLAALAGHPNAGGVLIVGLGCESNQTSRLLPDIGEGANVRTLGAQTAADEIEEGLALVDELVETAAQAKREPVPLSALVLGVKCGGSDGFSGLTANPLVGRMSDAVTDAGGAAILTEIPEIFGAEHLLMERAADEAVFEGIAGLVITTLEEKSLGAVQKGGHAAVTDVIPYGARVRRPGLTLLEAPGNDAVSSTALAAAGATAILFTTGRGTPLGFPVPTIKIASNSDLARRKPGWIDFDAGQVLDDGFGPATEALLEKIRAVASGEETAAERNDEREIAIWKRGVTL
jgi:altronate hydrolase